MSLSDNNGLGRSVSDVLAKTVRRSEPQRGYLEVDIGLIVSPQANPRTNFDSTALTELSQSIQQHGILQPIVVIRLSVGFEILSGERRFRAAKLAGLTHVPIVIREEENPQHVAELRLIENIQRENLNPLELARAYQSLIDLHGLKHEEIAHRVNKDRSSITNTLRLLTLSSRWQNAVEEGTLTLGHAKALLSCADTTWQNCLAESVLASGLSVRETERRAKQGPRVVIPADSHSLGHLKELEANLFHLLGTHVKVKERRGKGTLTLHFDSKDHFHRVVAIMERFVKQAGAEDRTIR